LNRVFGSAAGIGRIWHGDCQLAAIPNKLQTHKEESMSRPVGPGALWALILFCMTLAARADIRTGFGTESASFYPIDTFYSDSRYQFIIPREELRVETGEILSGLRLNLTQSSGYTFTFHIRVKHATQTDLDSMALGRFVNGGLTTSVPRAQASRQHRAGRASSPRDSACRRTRTCWWTW
jgi:hypothetical protein